ncbi:MAG TPA: hypothetical protein DIU48_01910 [Acidobacteria bacterium]|jgi:hypothetical protein|uniref:Uncharacterized protein n=1 Tax=marine metagenome TaxID=408172 RepID=A0A381YRP1_9ZZZZ|nr:hypothetical protein [Acidobacteriota bacterium]
MLKRLITLFFFVNALMASAQYADAQFVVREDVHVAPGTTDEFEANSKSRTTRMAAGNVEFGRLAAVSESGGRYRYLTLLDDEFSSVAEWREQIASMPAPPVPGSAAGLIESIDRSVWQALPDLSHTPDPLRITNTEIGFVREILLYPKFGSAPQVAELLGQIKQLYERHNIAGRRIVRQLVIGPDSPTFSIVFLARNPEDLYAESARDQATMGADLQSLVNRVGRLCRDVQFENYRSRQDLGYQPSN